MDKRLQRMEKKVNRAQMREKPGGLSKRQMKKLNREKAVKEAAKGETRRRAREYLESDGANWAQKLAQGVTATFAAQAPDGGAVGSTGSSGGSSCGAGGGGGGLQTAAELRSARQEAARAEERERAEAAREKVHRAWQEAEAKREVEAAAVAARQARKEKKRAERTNQQRALSFSLDDEEEEEAC
jgi:hypothetical protein